MYVSPFPLRIELVLTPRQVISKPALLSDSIWFGWLIYINPVSYAYEAVISNEFSGRVMECAPSQLVPQGPGVDPQYQACSLPGTPFGSRTVTGDEYLSASFD